ncbi:ATP phosphoribosyltransferase, partial [Sparassis latifolia]
AESLDGRLLFAIPKEGRLHKKCLELLAGADIQFKRHGFSGNVDLGITEQDVILEAKMERHVTEVLQLVPEAGPIQTSEALSSKRVVTGFEVLLGQYFSKIDDNLQLTGENRTKIKYVGGSVEAACALGLADGIVDLVESDDAMCAAGLHAVATVLQTEAPLIKLITSRLAGVVAAGKYIVCELNILRSKLHAATSITPGRRSLTISPPEDEEWVAVSSMAEKSKTADVKDKPVMIGAEDILIFNLDNCRV